MFQFPTRKCTHSQCIYFSNDWIEIRDGGNNGAPIIGNKWCGDKYESDGRLDPITSTTNEMHLHFHSRSDRYSRLQESGFRGFRIDVNFTLGMK